MAEELADETTADPKAAERRLIAQHAVGSALGTSDSLSDATPKILKAVCESLDWDLGVIWKVDEERGLLHCVETWHDPRVETLEDFDRRTRLTTFKRGQGVPGRVWASKQPLWIPNVLEERTFIRAALAAKHGIHASFACPIFDGDRIYGVMQFYSRAIREPDEALLQMLATVGMQVGQFMKQKKTEQNLHRAEELYRVVVENTQDLISVTDVEGRLIYASPSHEAVIGYTPAELLGRSALELIHPEDVETAAEAIRDGLLEGKVFRSEIRVKHKDGRWVTLEGVGTAIRDDRGDPVMLQANMRDVTDRKRAELEMAYLAYHDKLTGLPNRAMFEELADMAIARARRQDLAVAVLYIDLDNFKMVNDSLGHAAGDELLRQVAERLKEVSRASDVVARLAGDEFLLLLTDVQRDTDGSPVGADNAALIAETVATRTHEALSERFVLGDTEFYVSASIGISIFPLDAEDARTLVRNADAAMYRSKNAGPGNYSIFPLHSTEHSSKLSIVTRLRQSVNEQNFVLHYQPIVDLVRREMIGVEALLRWKDPERGLVQPNEFIPLAEEMGLIGPLGDWVVEELFRQWRVWRDQGMEFIVSFNLSPRQLWHPGLVEKLLERLDVWHMDPTSVLVEITESTAMTDPDRTQQILGGLRDRGIRIAIDDFGTGYSSLSRLKDLAVDVLKVDRSFVRDVPRDREAATMVKGIVQLAHSLNMAPLAEGIESEEQCRFLVGHGCLLGQGHYFSPPAPAEEMDEMWRSSFRLNARPKSW